MELAERPHCMQSIALTILNILNALVRWISPRGNKRVK